MLSCRAGSREPGAGSSGSGFGKEKRADMGKVFLYRKVYDELLERIRNGIYLPGSKLPGDEELCEEFGVSAITLKKALEMLAESGHVKRVPGKGTYVEKREKAGTKGRKEGTGHLLGLVLEHVSTPFGLEMMYQMDRIAQKAGYRLIVRFSYGDREKETEEIRFLFSMKVDGIIIMPSHGKHYSPAILQLYLDDFPMVMIDKKLRGIPVPSVRTDNRAAAAALVRELAEKGCRRIAFFTTEDTEAISVRERRNGFINEMERLNLTEAGICVLPYGRGAEGFLDNRPDPNAIRTVRKFLEKERREIDAVIAEEYGIVPVVTAAAVQVGIDLEQDIRLACIDEDYLAPYGPVFLHVKQDEAAIAKKAVELLLGRIAGNRYEEDDYLIAGILRSI